METEVLESSPWAKGKARDFDSWHSMCSYLGAFPPALARFFIERFANKGDIVFDPFSGRGTTILEARLCGNLAIGSDLNPIAYALSKAKATTESVQTVLTRIDELERKYDTSLYMPEAQAQPDHVHLIFHARTLAQLCYLKRRLLNSSNQVDHFLVGCLLGILHGGERKDGTSQYLSIDMPNTFSMSPEYVRRFVQTNKLNRFYRDCFQLLRDKVLRMYKGHQEDGLDAVIAKIDAKRMTTSPVLQEYAGKVKLVLTSPPYLGVVNYAKQNWIRAWILDGEAEIISDQLDDDLNLDEWIAFMRVVLMGIKEMLSDDGCAIFVIGDVAKSKNTIVPLAREFRLMLQENRLFEHVIMLSDYIGNEDKTTRIWGKTKGEATAVDRIVIVSNREVSSTLFDQDIELGQQLRKMVTT